MPCIQPNADTYFKYNQMAANADTFQVMFIGLEKGQKLSLEINVIPIRPTEKVKLHGIAIDSKLQFKSHVKTICKTANQKIKAFSRIAGCLQTQSLRALKDFYKVKFSIIVR